MSIFSSDSGIAAIPAPRDGSAEMNMWLHKAVMKKMAENGGKVPAELMD